jgi:hypothetical protein
MKSSKKKGKKNTEKYTATLLDMNELPDRNGNSILSTAKVECDSKKPVMVYKDTDFSNYPIGIAYMEQKGTKVEAKFEMTNSMPSELLVQLYPSICGQSLEKNEKGEITKFKIQSISLCSCVADDTITKLKKVE